MSGLGLSIMAPPIPELAHPAPAPTSDLSPLALGAAGAALYLAWLFYGTRENPPRGNPPIAYDKYRSGLTFETVRELLKAEQNAAYAAGQYMWVTRATVLGRWHELKLDQYDRYLEAYDDFGESGRKAGDIF